MSATTPFVGVRVFSDLSDTVASVDTRDSTVIGLTLPAPLADNALFPLDEPVALSIDDVEQVAALGAGLARDTVDQILSEGIVTDISFVRVAEGADAEATMGHIVGSAGAKTGVWAQLEANDHIGLEPGLLIAPGYTGSRPGNAANPITTAMDGVCSRIIDCMAVVDTPGSSREAAALYAEDFKTLLNIIAMYPGGEGLLEWGAGGAPALAMWPPQSFGATSRWAIRPRPAAVFRRMGDAGPRRCQFGWRDACAVARSARVPAWSCPAYNRRTRQTPNDGGLVWSRGLRASLEAFAESVSRNNRGIMVACLLDGHSMGGRFAVGSQRKAAWDSQWPDRWDVVCHEV